MSVFHTMCNPLTVHNIIGHISTFKIITAFFFFNIHFQILSALLHFTLTINSYLHIACK